MVNLSNFNSIHFRIDFENLTSKTHYISNPSTTFQEIGENNQIVFSLPSLSCNHGHHLHFKVIRADDPLGEPTFELEMTARVVGLESLGKALNQVTVSVLQIDSTQWEKFLDLLSRRQKAIDELLKRMRG